MPHLKTILQGSLAVFLEVLKMLMNLCTDWAFWFKAFLWRTSFWSGSGNIDVYRENLFSQCFLPLSQQQLTEIVFSSSVFMCCLEAVRDWGSPLDKCPSAPALSQTNLNLLILSALAIFIVRWEKSKCFCYLVKKILSVLVFLFCFFFLKCWQGREVGWGLQASNKCKQWGLHWTFSMFMAAVYSEWVSLIAQT